MTSEQRTALLALRDQGIGPRPAARRVGVTGGAACKIYWLARGNKDSYRVRSDRERPCAAFSQQLVVRVDDDTMAEVARRAVLEGTSRSQVVRDLLEWALESFPA